MSELWYRLWIWSNLVKFLEFPKHFSSSSLMFRILMIFPFTCTLRYTFQTSKTSYKEKKHQNCFPFCSGTCKTRTTDLFNNNNPQNTVFEDKQLFEYRYIHKSNINCHPIHNDPVTYLHSKVWTKLLFHEKHNSA